MKRKSILFVGLALFGLLVTGCNSSADIDDTKYFTVIWKNYDGTVLETDNQVKENTMPSYDGTTPIKAGDAQYSYAFSGWSPEVALVTSDIVYTAQFNESLNSYTVTWKNWDGSVLETDNNVPYGTMPSYDRQTPSRQKDAQYSYTFSGWSPEIAPVTGNISYTAEYSSELNHYTVVWKNWDGSVLETDSDIAYWTMPSYDGDVPTKAKDAQYTYTFSNWSPTISQVTCDVVYTAQFSQITNNYVITWKNWDGSVLAIDSNVPYGTVPVYNGTTPTKDGDEQYSFVFSGWSPNVTSVTGDATYTATFTKEVNKFTVTWKNWDGSVLETDTNVPYGSTPTYNSSTPHRDSTAQYSYTFSGWSPEIVPVTGDISYTAEYTSETRTYLVFWKNWDGSSLISSLYRCEYGTMPVYHGNTPTRPSDDPAYSYVFVGWSPELAPVTCSTTYTAQYEYVENKYTVTWQNWDGTILETDTDVPYGSTPSYDGSTPSRKDSLYTYEFTGWSPNIVSVTNNITYTAQFNSSAITYTISYDLDGGIGDNPTSYSVNSGNITLSQPSKNGYEFIGWTGSNGDVPEKNIVISCNSGANLTYTAHWEIITYNITYHLFGGTNNNKNPSTYTIEDTLSLGSPTKTGYDFNGWYLDSNFSEEISNLNGHYGNLDIYAKFSGKKIVSSFSYEGLQTFKVNYVVEADHSLDRTVDFVEGDTKNIYDYRPVGTNIKFGGWYSDSALTHLLASDTPIVGNITVYGKLLSSSDYSGDLFTSADLFVYGGEYDSKTLFNPCYTTAYARYSCKGSKGTQSGIGYSSSARVMLTDTTTNTVIIEISSTDNNEPSGAHSITLVPGHTYRAVVSTSNDRFDHKESRASLHITNVSNNSKFVYGSSVEQTYDSATLIPVLEERPGYDLTWCDDDGNPIHSIWDYLSDVSFHEVWTLHNYSINYELNGGTNSALNPTSYTIEDTITLNDPQKDGYTFDGWYSDSDFTNEVTTINGDELRDYVLYAKWTANIYVATFDYNGGRNCRTVNFYSQGNILTSVDLYEDTNLNYFVPDSPNPSLKFGGWYIDDDFHTLFSFEGTINSNLNLYAKWIDVFDYDFLAPDSSLNVSISGNEYKYIAVVSPINQTITISSSSDLDLFGAIFDSNWSELLSNDDVSDENLDFSITIDISAGELYYIGYRANQKTTTGDCTISISGISNPSTFITGDSIESINVTYDAFFELPTPKKDGYIFEGWYDADGNLVDNSSWHYNDNITIYAHWAPINS